MSDLDPYVITPHDIEVIGYCGSDAWVIEHADADNGRRLTIKPSRVKVSRSDYGRGRHRRISWSVYVEGRVIRQSDGELTTHRRGIGYAYPDDADRGYLTPLEGVDRLDPEILEFAMRARRMIEAAVEVEIHS